MKPYYSILLALSLIGCSNSKEENLGLDKKNTPEKVLDTDNYNVAFLIMDGVFNTELTAPFDVFQHTIFRDSIKAMNVFLVSNSLEIVTTFEGIRILPDFDYTSDKLPEIDILVVPSAEHHLDSDLEDEKMLEFVSKTCANAEYVMSHCDGAFVLAESGVLHGVESTTFPGDMDEYVDRYPNLKTHDSDSVLFVHDGKFITSAGGAKSFEASLYLCELLYGKKVAEEIASGLVIDWDLDAVPHVVVE